MISGPPRYLQAIDVAHDLHDRILEYRASKVLPAHHADALVRRVEETLGWMAIGDRGRTASCLRGLIGHLQGLSQAGTLNMIHASGLTAPAEMLLELR
jgi:hypothetical protein